MNLTTPADINPTESARADGIVIRTENREQTVALGRFLGARLSPGTIVCLDGDLGAGKTALTTGIAAGIGCRGPVASPTFTLLVEHEPGETGIPLFHFDVYRLADGDEFLELGFDEYLNGGGVSVIEWSSRIRTVLPSGCLQIDLALSTPDKPDERIITVYWQGHEHQLDELAIWGRTNTPC